MTNPYQPPGESPDARPTARKRRSAYAGGYTGVVGLTVGAGVVVGMLIAAAVHSSPWQGTMPAAFGAPALGWFCCLIALMAMLKGVQISGTTMVVTAFMLSIPAYVLYVPVCSFAAVFSTPVFGQVDYFPAPAGVIAGSAVAFLAIGLIFAAILRSSFRVEVTEDSPPRTEKKSDRPQQL